MKSGAANDGTSRVVTGYLGGSPEKVALCEGIRYQSKAIISQDLLINRVKAI